jgi:hypothetical protein
MNTNVFDCFADTTMRNYLAIYKKLVLKFEHFNFVNGTDSKVLMVYLMLVKFKKMAKS